MFTLYAIYFFVALGVLGGLITMILKIGTMMGTCPISNGAARSASITIATGYSAIGLGGVTLAAIILPTLVHNGAVALFAALGIASLALGLGFSQAMATLRGVVAEVKDRPTPAAVVKKDPWSGEDAPA